MGSKFSLVAPKFCIDVVQLKLSVVAVQWSDSDPRFVWWQL